MIGRLQGIPVQVWTWCAFGGAFTICSVACPWSVGQGQSVPRGGEADWGALGPLGYFFLGCNRVMEVAGTRIALAAGARQAEAHAKYCEISPG